MMKHQILGMRVDATSYAEAVEKTMVCAHGNEAFSIFAANTHMVMEAYDDPAFRQVINAADLVTPDGMPLVWWLRSHGEKGQPRVYGPDLMLHICESAAMQGVGVGFFGSTPEILESLREKLVGKYPGLKIDFSHSPPFSEISQKDDLNLKRAILASEVKILFVSLGCPKQEKWIAGHQASLPIVMVAVGAAFPLHAGTIQQAPGWMQRGGLEWLFRLTREPGRLWKRYLVTIPRFLFLVFLESLGIIHAQ
jgi:N-acetylglucosaminyldiphosphoundecaprenol N-acetyl-beta-D-mannosaminyltransferase